ncbi:ribosome silencing factor [Cystoisospora suis]|uniref:Ribosome silencing factor n=1 Tax=Cystoisospora suis TaxID=483139 RepID=A0A2C6KZ13_9APIC|nr:ribosome silencing factor [Cystoisospora suis]
MTKGTRCWSRAAIVYFVMWLPLKLCISGGLVVWKALLISQELYTNAWGAEGRGPFAAQSCPSFHRRRQPSKQPLSVGCAVAPRPVQHLLPRHYCAGKGLRTPRRYHLVRPLLAFYYTTRPAALRDADLPLLSGGGAKQIPRTRACSLSILHTGRAIPSKCTYGNLSLCHAVPILIKPAVAEDANDGIPPSLLPPLLTAVRAADSNKAHSVVAMWKKPGVRRVGWTEDMLSWTQQQQPEASHQEGHAESLTRVEPEEKLDTRLGTHRAIVNTLSGSLSQQGEAMLIVSGTCASHLDSLADAIIEVMWKSHMRRLVARDGRGYSGWVVLAFVDLEVHIMTPVTRQRYALEELYGLCPRIDVSSAVRFDGLGGSAWYAGGQQKSGFTGPAFDPDVDSDLGHFSAALR